MSGKIAALAAGLLLAACEGGPEERKPPTAQTSVADLKARIDSLEEGPRNAVFIRAVRDAGRQCQRVVGSAYNGLHFGMPGWVARCEDGRDWLVMLRGDGTALVAERGEKNES